MMKEQPDQRCRILVGAGILTDIRQVDNMPRWAEKYRAHGVRIEICGDGTIAAAALSRLVAELCQAGRGRRGRRRCMEYYRGGLYLYASSRQGLRDLVGPGIH